MEETKTMKKISDKSRSIAGCLQENIPAEDRRRVEKWLRDGAGNGAERLPDYLVNS
jgi:hypothetical protein